jgi:hypothetical protein
VEDRNRWRKTLCKIDARSLAQRLLRDIKPSGLPFVPKINSPFKLEAGVVGGQKRTLDEQ